MSTNRLVLWPIAATVALLTQSAMRSQPQSVRAAAAQSPRQHAAPASPSPSANASSQGALMKEYCGTCHNDRLKVGGFSLENVDVSRVGANPELWEKVVRKLRAGLMPPPGIRRPDLESYERLTVWLENELDRSAAGKVNPGAMGIHRLNRIEYA